MVLRVSEAGWTVRRLGGGLPADLQQPECAIQARSAGNRVIVDFVGPLSLCPYHGAALRRGEPAAAGDEEAGTDQDDGRARLDDPPDMAGRARTPHCDCP